MKNILKPLLTQKAATMVEAAMVLGILISLIFGVVEFSRYYAVKAMMTRAVKKGLERAIRDEDFLIDPNAINAGTAESNDLRNRLQNAYRAIDREANSVPVNTKIYESITWSMFFGGTPTDLSKRIMILRPGDVGFYYKDRNHTEYETVPHPTSQFGVGGDFAQKMETEPVVVEMYGTIDFALPFLKNVPIQAEAIGYVEKIKRGIDGIKPQTYDIPTCGDSKFSPEIEACDNISATQQEGLPDNMKCDNYCKEHLRCGDNIINPYGSYEENCDYGRWWEWGPFTDLHNIFCDENCMAKNPPLSCKDYKVTGDEGCDVALENLCLGYRWRRDNNRLEPRDNKCREADDAGKLLPDGFACIELTPTNSPITCKAYKLPKCVGTLVPVACPGEDQRPGQQGRYRCAVCSGGPGACDREGLNNQECYKPENSSTGIGRLPGVGDDWYCSGCNQIVDVCNNGVLDDGAYEECDNTAAPWPATHRPIDNSEYCDWSCKIRPRCGEINHPEKGNGYVDGPIGDYVEQCEQEVWGVRQQLPGGMQCLNCKVTCPNDPSCLGGLKFIPSSDNDPTKGICDCPTLSGVT
jgi:hypothetical protein